MESPMSRTRGRLLSFACEIQMSHHSMASRAGGAASGLATATLLANPAARQSALIKLTLIFINLHNGVSHLAMVGSSSPLELIRPGLASSLHRVKPAS